MVAGRIGNGTFGTEALLASGGIEDGCLGAVSSEGSRGDGGGDGDMLSPIADLVCISSLRLLSYLWQL